MQEISDILATFHDGGIEGYKGDFAKLELKIGCSYLAELEKAGNKYFYLIIKEVKRFEFYHWGGKEVKGLQEIIDLELEIGYSKVEEGIIKTSCNLYSEEQGDVGGELWIEAEFGNLRNQERKPMTPKMLYELSTSYWNN
ncbi:MAG: hypothetical protein AAF696_12415, partial [Bacteroidota bacterium]